SSRPPARARRPPCRGDSTYRSFERKLRWVVPSGVEARHHQRQRFQEQRARNRVAVRGSVKQLPQLAPELQLGLVGGDAEAGCGATALKRDVDGLVVKHEVGEGILDSVVVEPQPQIDESG